MKKRLYYGRLIGLYFGIIFIISNTQAYTQKIDTDTANSSLYRVNRLISGAIIASGFFLSERGLRKVNDKSTTPESVAINLSQNDVNAFDRVAFRQNVAKFGQSRKISDIILSATTLYAPLVLFIDKKIRHDWIDYSLLYLKTQALSVNTYAWGPPQFIRRQRPLVYYDETPLGEKIGKRSSNSFFSGHTSSVSTAAFFLAKVYSDYHPDKSKLLIYSLASLPPAAVGLYRIKGGKHFPTDVIVGYIVGATVGILVPHFHKNMKKRKKHKSSTRI